MILSSLSKVFEKNIFDQIVEFYEFKYLLTRSQFGFRKGCSTSLAVMNFIQKCWDSKENRLCVGARLYVLSKAFDTVDHETLLLKLKAAGFLLYQ